MLPPIHLLKKIMEFSSFFNQYFQHKEPWKNGSGTANCIFLSVNAARSLSIALFPFLPESAQKIWEQLGLDGHVKTSTWNDISELGISSGIVCNGPSFAKKLYDSIQGSKLIGLLVSISYAGK